MRKILRWIGILLGGLLGLILLAAVVLYVAGTARINITYNIKVETIPIPTNEQAIARGRHLAEAVTVCQACHGDQLQGTVLEDEPMIVTLSAPESDQWTRRYRQQLWRCRLYQGHPTRGQPGWPRVDDHALGCVPQS